MTDESGSVVARYSYDPYGRCTAATGEEIATRNPLRYRAYYADAETGMFYLPARYYDPATYRFLSQDPAAPSAGDPLSLNAYAYCLGDPVNRSDPSGAVSDVEEGAWRYYYNKFEGWRSPEARAAAEAATHSLRTGRSAARSAAAAGKSREAQQAAATAARQAAQAGLQAALGAWVNGLQGIPGDGTPYGRGNDIYWPSQPSSTTWGYALFGTVLDVVGLFTSGVVAGVAVLAAGVVADLMYITRIGDPAYYDEGSATRGDYWLSRWGVVPVVGSASTLGVLAGDWFMQSTFDVGIPWAQPSE
ncbi:MAG: RHS repeat-associated core domain-containing protein [Thermoleophilia bacterium]